MLSSIREVVFAPRPGGHRMVVLGFSAAVALLTVVGYLSSRHARNLEENLHWRAHTIEVVSDMRELLAHVNGAEIEQRGYIITGESAHFAAYVQLVTQSWSTLTRLRTLTSDNLEQQQRLAKLGLLLGTRFRFLAQAIDARQTAGFAAAQRLVASGGGAEAMQDVHRLLAEAEGEEQSTLEVRQARLQPTFRQSAWLVVGGTFATLAILGATFIALVKQIAERRRTDVVAQRARQALERSYAVKQQIMNQSRDVICAIDRRGRFAEVSDACLTIWGYAPDELIGNPYLDLVHADDQARTRDATAAIMAGESTSALENRYQHKNGSAVDIMLSAHWSVEHQLMFCVARDVTDRKRGEEQLRDATTRAETATRTKSEFLTNMSHEIRTPMNGVIGMLDLLSDTRLGVDQLRYVRTCRAAAESLLRVVNDIFDFSRVETGELLIEPIPFLLRESVDDVMAVFASSAHAKGVEFVADVPASVPTGIIGDPGRLRQILTNLVGNAIKFTARGQVVVRVSREVHAAGDHIWLRFTVTDSGIGIPLSKRQEIFEPFMQADGSTTRKAGGTGLGLIAASQLVRLMGGRIWVEDGIGGGSTFLFTLPFEVSGAPEPVSLSSSHWELSGATVLVIDDSAKNRRVVTDMLHSWNMLPMAVADGPAAVRELSEATRAGRPVAIIMLDAGMPGMNGTTMLEQLRSMPSWAETPVIVMTSDHFSPSSLTLSGPVGTSWNRSEPDLSSDARLLCIAKPITEADLLSAVMTALEIQIPTRDEEPVAGPEAPRPARRIRFAEDTLVTR